MSGKRATYTAYDRDQVAKWKAAIAASRRQQRQRRGKRPPRLATVTRAGMARVRPTQTSPPAEAGNRGRNNMTESGQPGEEIRTGDKVRRRDTEQEGDVLDLLPFYGGFQGAPDSLMLLFTVAVVRWQESRQKAVVRVDDLVKLT